MTRRNGKGKNRKNFFKKHKSEVVSNFLELVARELKEVEHKLIKQAMETGFSQTQQIVFGLLEIYVRPARNGEVVVIRKVNDKALMKNILNKVNELKKGRKNERKKWKKIKLIFSKVAGF